MIQRRADKIRSERWGSADLAVLMQLTFILYSLLVNAMKSVL